MSAPSSIPITTNMTAKAFFIYFLRAEVIGVGLFGMPGVLPKFTRAALPSGAFAVLGLVTG